MKIFSLINSRLWIKVLIPVSLSVLVVMGISLWVSIMAQNKLGQEQLTTQNKTLARAIEGGMFDALAIGDNDTVQSQFKRLNEQVQGLKVYVYDFNKVISFSTDINAVGKSMDDYASAAAAEDLGQMMIAGKTSGHSVQMEISGEDYLIKNDPIMNEQKCYHCHGHKRDVLGGISVLSSMTQMEEGIARGRNNSIAITAGGLCLIVLLVWLVFQFMVNNKVKQVVDATSRLREKDFTHQYEVKKGDEVNHILNRIGLVTGELRQTIQTIIHNSGLLDEASHKMSTIARTLDTSSAETSQNASNVSAAAEEMSANNIAIAAAMDDASESLAAVAAAVEEMTATVGEIAKNSAESKAIIDQVVLNFKDILQAVEDLGVRADDVDEVTDEIRSISEQVSLLALNAKIEAARAGEAGKGFAVVAQEITELAADTSQSTLEADQKLAAIKDTIKDLIEQVGGLAGKVSESDDAISGIAASVEEQNATTLEISKSVNEVTTKIADVNQSVTQGAQVASEIAQDIVAVEEMSSKVQEESHTLNKEAKELAGMAENVTKLMKQFKV